MLTITDVRACPGDSAFLLDDGETSVLYDTGFGFTAERVAENIAGVLKGRKLDYLLLTHSHYDHALGSVAIQKHYPNVKVAAGEYAVKIFGKPTARRVMAEMDEKAALGMGIIGYTGCNDEITVDIPLKDGDLLHAGRMVFEAVALPGHTKCSFGFWMPEEKLLLSCESLGVYDGDRLVVPSFLVGYQLALDSMKRVEALGVRKLLLPHFGILDGDRTEYYLQEGKKSAEETVTAICDIFKKGGTREDAIAYFRDTFYRAGVPAIYPEDAMMLNTGIMVDLIARECMEA